MEIQDEMTVSLPKQSDRLRFASRSDSDMLLVKEPGVPLRRVLMDKDYLTLGRETTNDIVVKSHVISRKHARLYFDNVWYYQEYVDNINGTFYYEHKLSKTGSGEYAVPVPLEDGCILRVDSPDMTHELGVLFIFSRSISRMDEWRTVPLGNGGTVGIGRSPDNRIVLRQADVGRHHAVITRDAQGYRITDLGSVGGTMVHNVKLTPRVPVRLHDRDVIKISSRTLILWDNELIYHLPPASGLSEQGSAYATPSAVGIQVRDLCLTVKADGGSGCKSAHEVRDGKKYLLNHVSFDIFPGEFVAVLGGSGAGKTTLVNCLNGVTQEPAYTGSIKYGTTELRDNYNGLRSRIGIAPQSDTVYDYLTVREMLEYTALLRMSEKPTRQELEDYVQAALQMVNLKDYQRSLIKVLSGGQRKRASIAAELVCSTETLFLDEPTSGLDPETEVSLMRELKTITKELQKTIIVITHTLQSIHYFDKIIFMAPGGYLSCVGSMEELKRHYRVENLIDAYEIVSKEKRGG